MRRWFALLSAGIVTCAFAQAQEALYNGPHYVAWLTEDAVELRTPAGDRLTRWPLGATVTQSDPDAPLAPVGRCSTVRHRSAVEDGVAVSVFERSFSRGPFRKQIETLRFHPRFVEYQVRVRWRESKPTFVRMVYGGRLAEGCYDLEGLWRAARSERAVAEAEWLPTPIPGLHSDPATITYRRTIVAPGPAEDMVLLLGGTDDEDVAYVDSIEVGRTPLNTDTRSWTLPRRYEVGKELLRSGKTHVLGLEIPNADGPGGVWGGPCVLGPRRTLQDSRAGDGWEHASATGKRLFHWSADKYEQPLTEPFTVSLTCQDRTTDWVPGNVTSGGRFQFPPYLVAIEGDNGVWWGIGTLEIPRAEDGLRVEWRDGALTCPFLLRTGDPAERGKWIDGPRLGLFIGDSRAEILRAYMDLFPMPPEEPRPAWWSGPEYCTWGDQVYEQMAQRLPDAVPLTDARVQCWWDRANEIGLTFPLFGLDAAWWRVSRDMIARLHDHGKHVVVWTQVHWGNLAVPEIAAHPEWGIRDVNGKPINYGNYCFMDFSQAGVREYVDGLFRSYLAEDEWNADGVMLDFGYVTQPLWTVCADSAWGAGEQYRARVLQFIYGLVKKHRKDGLMTGNSINPLFGRVQDLCRLNEDWTNDPQTYRNRAKAVLELGQWVLTDDWDALESSLAAQLVERPVWGALKIQSVRYRGNDYSKPPVALSESWAKRLEAVSFLASRAPVLTGQRIAYDSGGNISRVAQDGTLVASARRLEGVRDPAQVLVVAERGRWLVAAIADGAVVIPLDRSPQKIYAIRHDGSRADVAFCADESGVRLTLQDSAGSVSYYEILMPEQPPH